MKKIYPYILIIVLLIIVALIVFRTNKNNVSIQTLPGQPVTNSTETATTTLPSSITVAGMQQYTDAKFGFSFWYPKNWEVKTPTNPPFGAQIEGATVVAVLGLEPIGATSPAIIIKEAQSSNRSITDTGGAGPIGPITYFFDPTTHLWMTTSAETGNSVTTVANTSVNTMGGLHLFPGTSRFDTEIIPLSADNFVVINDGGGVSAQFLEKTVTATNPAVAVPVSTPEQIQTIQAEAKAFAMYTN